MDIITYAKTAKIQSKLEEITTERIISEEYINSAESMVKGFRDSRNSGEINSTYAGFRSTTLIPVSEGDVVYVYNPTENSVTISTKGVYFDANQQYVGAAGTGSTYGDFNVTVPSGVAYVSINAYRQDTTDYTAVPSGFVVNINNKKNTIKEINVKPEKVESNFYGLTGVAFGTSLTYRSQSTGGFLNYLPQLSGITFDNQGVSSSYILGSMLTAIKNYTGYSGKRVALLEGFVNDWGNNKTLGTWKDMGETTVCGCVRSAINYMLSQNANLTVFLILDPYGRSYGGSNCSSTAENGSNLTQFEYYEEIAKVAESLGIPVIKMYAESQISENTPQYVLDNIHPNELGAKQSAYLIWSKMKQYYPNRVSE